jgi:hypothetical protein
MIVRRMDAIANGDIEYFTGKPCRNGNISARSVINGNCRCNCCKKERSLRSAAWQKINKDSTLARVKRWQTKNPEKVIAIRSAGKVKHDASRAAWAENNKGRIRANVVRYRATKINACPKWADQHAIREIYRLAARERKAGADVHVDHIIPLRGDLVCGLHVEYNLQVIPAAENLRKHNRLTACQAIIRSQP